MSVKKKKRKSILKSRFYQVYFAVVALALIAIAVGTVWLRGVLADYESAQPVYVAENVAKLFEAGDYQRLYELDTSAEQIAGGDKDFYLQSMEEIAAGKTVKWSEAFSGDDDLRKYNVTLDGEKFATFTLKPSGKTTPRGVRLWALEDVTTYVTRREPDPVEEAPEETVEPEPEPEPTATPEPLYECRITAPSGYTVTVDDVTLSEENAQLTTSHLFDDGFLPENVENPAMTTYVYGSPRKIPAVRVTDEAGNAITAQPDVEKLRVWNCGLKEDEELKEKYSDSAYKLGQRIAKFMSKDSGKGAILGMCLKNSPARTIFDNLSNDFATPHNSAEFKNKAVTEFYRLSDTCFTCRVTFDYVLHTRDGDRVYPTAYTFCLVKDGKGGLYNLQIK